MNQQLCWICGQAADSAEHMVKASDLRSVFGHVTQDAPLYRHAGAERNLPVRGINASPVKFKPSICQACNNALTQPHDRAWEALSKCSLSHQPPLGRGSPLPVEEAFGSKAAEGMLGVHLFFTKLLGCYLTLFVGRSRFAEDTKTGGSMHDLISGVARILDSDHLCSPRLYCQRFQRQPWAVLGLPPATRRLREIVTKGA